jgi:signal transduction histidine kinase
VSQRRPQWTRTIRFRLTVTYSSLLFGLAALLVGAIYFAVSRRVEAAPISPFEVDRVIRLRDGRFKSVGDRVQAADVADIERAVNYETLSTLRTYSIATLAVLFLLSLAIGWWLSGRVLRPVRRIASTAADISATDLSRRIGRTGPDDELGQLAGTIDEMLARLEAAFAAQRRLLDDASHELRNPLAVIQTNVDAILARDDVSPADRRQAALVVTRATTQMSRLVEDLLATARRESGAFADADVDLSGVVHEAAEEFRLLAAERGLTLRTIVDSAAVVNGDHDALRRAIANLLSNAVRLAPDGSEIGVATGARAGWCWLAVRDEGPGIPAADRDRVFDRFWRSDGDRDGGHTGLGLAIVRQIAESHGGSVAVHTAKGRAPDDRGSTFVLWLPAGAPVADVPQDDPMAGAPRERAETAEPVSR